MRKKLPTCLALMIASMAFAQTVYKNCVDGELFIKLKSSTVITASLTENKSNVDINSLPFLKKISRTYSVKNISHPFAKATDSDVLPSIYSISFANSLKVDQFIADLMNSGQLEYAEKVPLHSTHYVPNDPSYSTQWNLATINAAGAWDYSKGNANIVVATVDDAVDITHPDLTASIWTNPNEIAGNGIDDDANGYIDDVHGWNFGDNNGDPNPPDASFSHGTHVSGALGARSDNGVGIASIGYGISILPVRCSTPANNLAYTNYGVYYAIVAGARVINMSFGGGAYSATEQSLMDYAYGKGIVLVSSAGNGNVAGVSYPSGYNHVICVAATATDDSKSSYSCYGPRIDIAAPGDNILSTDVGGVYGAASGTSFACPQVSGLCGLMLSLNPYLTPDDVLSCLKANADNIDDVNPSYIGQLGAGRINAANTMACVQASLAWKPTTDFTSNFTSITQGGAVTFTDASIHNPTTWNWTFTGGTPSSYTGKTPPVIKYNTTGSFAVSLTTSNGNGSDTRTRTAYIVVAAPFSCTLLNSGKALVGSPVWNASLYGANGSGTGAADKDGYIFGLNGVDTDLQKAQYFDNSASPVAKLTRVEFYIYKANSTDLTKTVTFNVYDGTSGSPGALLGSATRTLCDIRKTAIVHKLFDVGFSPAVSLPASQKFFIAVDCSNLNWATAKDTFALLTNATGQTNPSGVWEEFSTGVWAQMGTTGTWNAQCSMYIFPYITDSPPIATITSSATTICQGASVNLDATGSTYQDTLVWKIPGGKPSISNSLTQDFIFKDPGTYVAKVFVAGGGCNEPDSANVTITVNPEPTVSISSSQGTTICSGTSTVLTASGASTYTWFPTTSLNVTSGASVSANPTNTITYSVTGDNGLCTSNSSILITVNTCTGIEELFSSQNINAFYNSLSSQLNINVYYSFDVLEVLSVNLFNQLGQTVYTGEMELQSSNTRAVMQVPALSAGIYTLQLLGKTGMYNKKLIIN